jgi:hypothetical protein
MGWVKCLVWALPWKAAPLPEDMPGTLSRAEFVPLELNLCFIRRTITLTEIANKSKRIFSY